MNKIITWSVTVAVAGFLFGFDTAVISGADQAIQALWETSPLVHGLFVMSSALWGTVLGALSGNIPCDKLGRKKTLVIIGVLYLLSAIGSALAQDPYTFAILRFIGGVGVGISSIVVPAYISEIAPANLRGRLVATYQFQIVFGILIAFLSNYLLTGIIPQDWRVMLGIEAIPALVYLLLVLKAPESPRWLLLKHNKEQEAREIMQALGSDDIDNTITQVRESAKRQPNTSLFKSEYKLPITLAFLIAAFNQLSGINFIIYYAPRVFEMAGLDASNALLSTAGVGLVNLVFTMVGISLIDKCGRKLLMYVGSIGYILSLATVSWAFYGDVGGTLVVVAIFVFIASHALGQGAVIWVFIAEIFPNSVRSKGQSLGSGTHWVFAAIITLAMPQVLATFSASQVFFFFTLAMFLQLIFVRFMMPETKGRTLEDVASELSE
ncbi:MULTISPECIES: sugar porter family MFS transporter [Alteromonas]|jgi:SP family xylose:H+ symportor-like MFS transporter|uniref:MFS transporter n=1 Tax=Alteromonas stellipolaris TaxID=233316 RepID=A0AAW7Z5W7_9ALTE|nr:sugar porter family MFS transporter [Alteromonas stellipolaris]ALM89530.1 D-xylose proton-symporter XylE [Alteromonas stellipolaris LMG 21856]AMJ75353.1 MFS transporter [Alteromonas stellipolaris]AMJ95485.1 MFS transporter [Alteromonas stellipolaris]ANB21514.1 MFS transporter [Alteromonas stellipolaris]ANB24617.1 MFS transporter [Alteromonas stellipolaris]